MQPRYTPPMRARRSLAISLVTETFAPEVNGVAMTLSRITSGLRQRGHRLTVIRPRMPADYPEGCPGDTAVRMLSRPGRPIPNYPLMRIGVPSKAVLSASWRADPPDLVHVATEGPMGVSALLAARALGIPCTSSFHTNFDDYTADYGAPFLARPVGWWLRWVHNLARCTMVPTAVQALALQRRGYRGVCILSRGTDTDLFDPARRSEALRRQWGAGPDTLVLMVVGRVAAEKNLSLAVRALRTLRVRRPDTLLVLVGAGPEQQRLRAEPGVVCTGTRCGCDLGAHYASADLFCFPSTTETYGNVLPEAMAAGLATVAFDYAAARELVTDGVDGRSVALGDEGAFISAVEELADDAAARARLGVAARQRVACRSWPSVIDAFEGHVLAALGSR